MNKKIVLFGLVFMMLLFSTVAMGTAPTLSYETPTDTGTLWDMDTTSVNVTIYDADSNFNWTLDFSPNIGNNSGYNATNGSKTCTISGLNYSTTYTWTINASDFGGTDYVNTSYTFTTKDAKLRENPELNLMEKSLVGVAGVIILIGFLYVILKMKFEDEKTFAKLLISVIVALVLLGVLFSAL